MKPTDKKPLVAIIMGSDSDWPTLQPAADACTEFGIPCEVRVVSAHRTPDEMFKFAKNAHKRGIRVIIAGAGGAAHLPGMVASLTPLPVIGVPVESRALKGMDSLLSIVQMPAGVPVATMAINGGRNAGLMAARILGSADPSMLLRVSNFQTQIAKESSARDRKLQASIKPKL
jgi:5-(carboxyamino)imidazole ribonucleotide mutase